MLGLAILPVAELHAKVPPVPSLTRYQRLWNDSPLTTKPEVVRPAVGPGPLDEWALGGVSETERGFLLVLFNRTKPQEKLIIAPGDSKGFEILEVRRDPANYLQTQVQLRYKNATGWVGYEESLLAIKAPAPQRGPNGRPDGGDPRGNPGRDPRAAVPQPAVPQQNGERRTRDRVAPTAPTPPTSSSRR
jgi:hypothetical protein